MKNGTAAKLALTVAVLAGGAGFLVYSSTSHAQHYEMVDNLIAKGFEEYKDKAIKVHGYVVAGSIAKATVNQETRHMFVLHKNGKKIRVFVTGPTPDTFKDESEVVASGRLVFATTMQPVADSICAKPDTKLFGDCRSGTSVPVNAEQEMVVEATELMAKCPSKYKGAPSNQIDTTYK
jgi:cytochrome c-type biogenesis protein CcmE